MNKLPYLFIGCTVAFALMSESYAANVDERFLIELDKSSVEDVSDIQAATALALPMLWQRVVPIDELSKTEKLPKPTSLVLQFKAVKHGVKLVFNPSAVKNFLSRYGIQMIPERPHWNLSVYALGFSDADEGLSQDLLNYGHEMADQYGFRLSPRGKKLQLIFAPVIDTHGELQTHVDVQGSFSAGLLSQVDLPVEGYISYQLQSFLHQILIEIRDAYSLDTLTFEESSREILLTIEAEYSLASQVMLEQALARQASVVSVVPTMLQKARRQYRIQLRDGNDSWITAWFAGYGLTANRQPEGSVDDWLAE